MKNIPLILLLFLLVASPLLAQQANDEIDAMVSPKIAEATITVGGNDADIVGFNNRSIQLAIDAVAKTGGTVKLDTGIYEIAAPVRMRSNVALIGSGKGTVLKKIKGVQTRLTVDADYGELKLTVENAEGFLIGMKVQVSDKEKQACWDVSTVWITDIQEKVFYVEEGLIRDYRSDLEGFVSNASSVIEVIGQENVTITDLTADGNKAETFKANGCKSAGVYVFRSKKVTLAHVHIKDFNGEGVSWQITEHVTVRNCEISGSGNTGLHPGTGSPFTVIENNDVHHSEADGLFICWRVYQSQVLGNKFHHNGRYGICTGHKDTDVTFTENHIFSNGRDGVHLRGERKANAPHRNTFVKNVIENNGTAKGGFGLSINSPAQDLLLKENTFRNNDPKFQQAAIYIHANGSEPKLENNQIGEHPMGGVVYEKK